MKIVVLDGYALNPGDLSWDGLKNFGEVIVYERTPVELVTERSKGAEILFTNKTPLTEDNFKDLPLLRYIGVLATGYNVVDIESARKRNITVTNIPAYSTMSVAQMTFAFILEFCHHVQRHSDDVHSGAWTNCKDFSFHNYPLIELADKTLGIIGFGRIGRQVADIAGAFGMKIIAYNSRRSDQSHRKNFKWVDLDKLFEQADILSLHCPLTDETRGLVNKTNLSKMKKSAFLINTSRGPVVVEEDLAEALNNNMLAGAGVDVLSTEPPKPDNPLLTAKNCVITPHFSWATFEARARLMSVAAETLKAYLENKPINVVNK